MKTTTSRLLTALRSRVFPGRFVGELLTKSWIDIVIPAGVLVGLVVVILLTIPGFFGPFALADQSRQLAEYGLVVMLSGGIDLSVGSIFALCVLTALTAMNVLELPVLVALAMTAAVGLLAGAINGILIGYLKLRAFITTLVTLAIFRSLYDLLFPKLATKIVMGFASDPVWDMLAFGSILNISASFLVFSSVALAIHLMLSRLRLGWHIRTIASAYVFSGLLTALATFLFSARYGRNPAILDINCRRIPASFTRRPGHHPGRAYLFYRRDKTL